jgi:hypothetical protein
MDARVISADGRRPRNSGQAMLEFALVLVVLLILFLGIIDFARLFYTWSSIANAAREGARFGTVHPKWWTAADHTPSIESRTRELLFTMGTDSPEVIITCRDKHYPDVAGEGWDYCSRGNQIHVVVRAQFRTWTPIIPTMNLSSSATMVIE